MGTYIIRKRGNEMYIIRKHKTDYEDIIAGRLNTMMVKRPMHGSRRVYPVC